jgi:hypothetical protein
MVTVGRGRWRADLYAHVGSMNGRELAGTEVGAWFRKDHPGRPFPLWLVRLLRFSGHEDPGHEQAWKKPDDRIRSGEIPVDLQTRGFVGFLLHLHKGGAEAKLDQPQNGDWFVLDTGARTPVRCPAGLPSAVEDPSLVSLARDILGERDEPAALPTARQPMDVLAGWRGAPLAPLDGAVELPVSDLVDAYLLPSLAHEGSVGFEVRVRPAAAWTPPAATADWAVVPHDGGFRAGPPPNWGGWPMLDAATRAGASLASLPEGSRLEFAARDVEVGLGRSAHLWLAGEVTRGTWRITEVSPAMSADTLRDAFAYVRDMRAGGRVAARDKTEHVRLKRTLKQLELFVDRTNPPSWEGATLVVSHEDIRGRFMLAGPLFRQRYAAVWPKSAR